MLERLADYTENREVTRQKVLGAMLYPIVLSIICFGIVTGMMVYVVPKVIEVFESSKRQAAVRHPGADRRQRFPAQLGHLSRDCASSPPLCRSSTGSRIPTTGGAFTASSRAAARPDAWCAASIPRASRARSASSRPSAVPVLEAMRIAGEVVTNLPMRDAVAAAAARVREGAPIGRSLAQSKLFPP